MNQFQNQQGQPVPGNPFGTGIPRPGSAMGGPMGNQFRPNSPFGQQQMGQMGQGLPTPPFQNQQQAGIPNRPPQGQPPGAGTGPQALRNIIGQGGTGIPRGGGIPRPGGRGGGQAGNAPNQQTGGQQGPGSQRGRGGGHGRGRGGGNQGQVQGGDGGPGAGRGMNANARQFVPNKRPRDEAGTDGDGGGPKRARGGGNAGS
ncbi:hypothetical protein IWX46DRAFT_591004 [Phyllosticta citricarpa]|uniref:Uncharacterized protein n=1 Tax=Phyllosticta citricarpa TaxID=55181 RepID=A0ABR1MPW4_9PEZI